MKKYYVYALDISGNVCITAALSFQDEDTAEQAYQYAMQEMIADNIGGVFRFGFTSDSQVVGDDLFVDVDADDVQLSISFPPLSEGGRTHRIFGTGEFEKAELRTERFLSNRRYSRQDIQFMRCVELILQGRLPTALEIENASSSDKPTQQQLKELKMTKSRQERQERSDKFYENAVRNYLTHLNKIVKKSNGQSHDEWHTRAANLTFKQLAKRLQEEYPERFKIEGKEVKLDSIEQGIRRTNAWKYRGEILTEVFTVSTPQNKKKNRYSPFAETS